MSGVGPPGLRDADLGFRFEQASREIAQGCGHPRDHEEAMWTCVLAGLKSHLADRSAARTPGSRLLFVVAAVALGAVAVLVWLLH